MTALPPDDKRPHPDSPAFNKDGSGVDGTPAWAYDEDSYCVCCGNGRWKFHMPECELRDALDAKEKPSD